MWLLKPIVNGVPILSTAAQRHVHIMVTLWFDIRCLHTTIDFGNDLAFFVTRALLKENTIM